MPIETEVLVSRVRAIPILLVRGVRIRRQFRLSLVLLLLRAAFQAGSPPLVREVLGNFVLHGGEQYHAFFS